MTSRGAGEMGEEGGAEKTHFKLNRGACPRTHTHRKPSPISRRLFPAGVLWKRAE